MATGSFTIADLTGDAVGFECSEEGVTWVRCDDGTYDWAGALLDGESYVFSARAIDGAGNTDPTPATWSWTVDLTAPATTITSGPDDPTAATSATFTYVDPTADAVAFECSENSRAIWND